MSPTTGAGGDAGNGGDDTNVVGFPATAAERAALRRARQDQERQRLVNVFIDEAGGDQALFCTPDGVAFADLIVAGHRETWPIKSKPFYAAYVAYLRRQFNRLISEEPMLAVAVRAAMRKPAINAAIADFEVRTVGAARVRDVCVRVAGHDGEIYIDLCNDDWSVVRVTAANWSVVECPPVRFQRTPGMQPLPLPERGGTIEALRPFLNVALSDFVLVVAFLLAALHPCGPYPIFDVVAEQGTGKTSLLRILRSLTDPHVVASCALPLSGRDLFIAARNTHLQTFSNVSTLSNAMSDHLCRLADGGGLRIRTLFSDAAETHFRGARPIALEGIANVVSRPDFQERALIFQLERLPAYRTERDLLHAFDRQRASIFGALLDILVHGLEMLPVTRLVSPPRMADFAYWAVACGLDRFEEAYAANRQSAILVMLSHDPVAKAVRALVARRRRWRGTMEDLLDVVGPTAGIRSTRKLSDDLRRLTPMLRTVGVHIVYEQRTAEQRLFRIERTEEKK